MVSTDTMQSFCRASPRDEVPGAARVARIPYHVPAADMQSLCARNRVRPSWCCSGFALRPPNAAGKSLLGGLADSDELWSFTARWQTTWGQEELRERYVLVRNGSPGDRFLTVWKDLPGEEGTRVNFTGMDR